MIMNKIAFKYLTRSALDEKLHISSISFHPTGPIALKTRTLFYHTYLLQMAQKRKTKKAGGKVFESRGHR